MPLKNVFWGGGASLGSIGGHEVREGRYLKASEAMMEPRAEGTNLSILLFFC